MPENQASGRALREFINTPVPLWVIYIFIIFLAIAILGEHSERQKQTRDLDRRVTQLENSRR
jgi:hypothetical protein